MTMRFATSSMTSSPIISGSRPTKLRSAALTNSRRLLNKAKQHFPALSMMNIAFLALTP
jgi:hypothetical protein